MIKEEKIRPQDEPARNPETIDLNNLKSFLENNGLEVVNLEQPWRNVIGKVKRDSADYFFKLGTNPEISERVHNESVWNKIVASQLDIDKYQIPLVQDTGSYRNLFWMTTEFIEGKLVAARKEVGRLENWLPQIVGLAAQMNSLARIELPRDREFRGKDANEVLLNKAKGWANEVEHDCQNLLTIIMEAPKLSAALQHGDFVPWHIMITEDHRLALIDGEHANNVYPKHYDAAYFYHRVYTLIERPDLAESFLQLYRDRLPIEEKDTFAECFRPVIAQRIIGGFFDAKMEKVKDLEFHLGLESKILKNS